MSKFGICKYPRGGGYLIFYCKGRFPKCIARVETKEEALKKAIHYAHDRLHTAKVEIEELDIH